MDCTLNEVFKFKVRNVWKQLKLKNQNCALINVKRI